MVHHRLPYRLPVGRLRELAGDAPARHHAHAVGQLQHFVEVFADQQHRRAAVAGGAKARMHLGAGTHVEPAARAVREHQSRRLAELARQHQLLRIAARQQRRLLCDRAHALHVEGAHGFLRVRLYAAPAQAPHRAVAAGVHAADGVVLRHRQAAREREPVAVGRNRGNADAAPRGRGHGLQVAVAFEPDLAFGRLARQAHDGARQLALPVTADAGKAVDFAGMQLQVDTVEHPAAFRRSGRAQPAHREAHRSARSGRGLEALAGDRLAHRELHQFGGRGVGRVQRGHRAAAAHYRHAVGVCFHVGHLVRDQHHRGALAREALHRLQQARGLLVGEHGGGLVEDQDARAREQHLEDFHALLFGNRKCIDALGRIDVEAQLRGLVADVALYLAQPFAVALEADRRRRGEQDVLRHGERPHQLEMLVNHADALPGRIARPGEAHRVVVHQQLPGFGRIEPGRDVHERRLARAVLPQQRMHLAPARGEVGVGQRGEAVEGLADAGEFQCVGHGPAYFCVTTPLTNQSIFQRSASDSTAPLATRSLPSRSASGPA